MKGGLKIGEEEFEVEGEDGGGESGIERKEVEEERVAGGEGGGERL